MRFELTGALINDILFHMEDQNGEFHLDTRRGYVVGIGGGLNDDDEEAEDGGDRFAPLPGWDSSDGYRLMERFAAGLHSPVIREELSAALDRGRGVFRAFKDALSRHPELEKRWFGFKEREMKRKIIRWYNTQREAWGLELIGDEPEDIDGLALEDFRFRGGLGADAQAAAELHRRCGDPLLETISPWIFPGDLCVVAETAGGEFAGCTAAVWGESPLLHIRVLEVAPEYRGLGLGTALLGQILEKADTAGVFRISIDVPAGMEHFSRALLRESFEPRVLRYCRRTY